MRRLALVVIALASALLPLPPAAVERQYSRAVYPHIQRALTSFSNTTPVALFDILLVLAGAMVLFLLMRRGRILNLLTFAAVLWLFFFFVWGLNYRRVRLEEKLAFDAQRLTPGAVTEMARLGVEELNRLHREAHAGDPPGLEAVAARLAPALEQTASDLQIEAPVAGRPKQTFLAQYFRRAGVDGMIDPFLLETLIGSNLLDVEQPAAIAHEWGHLAGFANEAEASFFGWLTCMRGDSHARYSGWLALYPALAAALPDSARKAVQARLGAGPREDLRRIAERVAEADEQTRALAFATYDKFLRANRVAEGVESYSAVTRLVVGTEYVAPYTPQVR